MKIKLRAIFCLGFPFCCSFHLANYFSYSVLKFAVFFSHSFFYSFLPCVTSFGLVLSHVYWVLSPEKCTRALSGAIFFSTLVGTLYFTTFLIPAHAPSQNAESRILLKFFSFLLQNNYLCINTIFE